MRKLLLGLLLPLAVLVAPAARADEPDSKAPSTPTLEVGARTGASIPVGSAIRGASLGDAIDAQVPIQLDLGVRLMPNLFVGAYGSYGLVFPADKACGGASCSGSDVRVGVQAHYHFRPEHTLDPWLGVGAGYEWLTLRESQDGVDRSATLRGFELVNLQAGLDYRVGHFGIGPFAGFSVGQFDKLDESITARGITRDASVDVPNTALHEWVTVGLRGTFDL